MNRRQFLIASAAAVAVPFIPTVAKAPAMRHVYENGDGERIAANTLHEAATFHDCTLGVAPAPDLDDWTEIDDDEQVTVGVDDRWDAGQDCSYTRNGHSAPGWYVYYPEYPDEGSQHYDERPTPPVTKTAREWAAEHTEPGYVSSTYC